MLQPVSHALGAFLVWRAVMALVTITGKAWGHGRDPVPAQQQPRLWFRPDRPHMVNGLMDGRGVEASLDPDGSFTVKLESFVGVKYIPTMGWLLDETQAWPDDPAAGYEEWPAFFPGEGGDISTLTSFVGVHGLLFGFGDPPARLSNVVYLDIAGPAIRIFGPKGGRV